MSISCFVTHVAGFLVRLGSVVLVCLEIRLPTFSFTILCNNVALLSGVSWFSRKLFPRIALENQLKGALMDLKNHLMKSTTVSINRE